MPRDSRRGAGRRGAVAGIRSQPRPPGACRCCRQGPGIQLFGYGSWALSPPLTVSNVVPLQFGHGGMDFSDCMVNSWPQFVHLYVPADTSLPVGTGSAIETSCVRSDPPYPAGPRQNSRVADVDALEGGEQPVHDLDVLLRHRPRSIPREGGEEKDGGWVRTPTKARVTIAAMLERLFASRPKRNLLAGASCSKLRRGLGGWAARSLSPSRLNEHPADRD